MKRNYLFVKVVALFIIVSSIWALLIGFGVTALDVNPLRTVFQHISFAKFLILFKPGPMTTILYSLINLFFLLIGILLFFRANTARIIFLITQGIYLLSITLLFAFIAIKTGGSIRLDDFIQITISHLRRFIMIIILPVFYLFFFTREFVKEEFAHQAPGTPKKK